jgi:hypothetical protein
MFAAGTKQRADIIAGPFPLQAGGIGDHPRATLRDRPHPFPREFAVSDQALVSRSRQSLLKMVNQIVLIDWLG